MPRPRVLVIYDRDNAYRFRTMIEALEYETDVEETFEAALEFLRDAPDPSIVVAGAMTLWWQTKFFDGVEAGGQALRRHIYIAFDAGSGLYPEFLQRLFRLAAFDLRMPFTMDELEETLGAAAALLPRST